MKDLIISSPCEMPERPKGRIVEVEITEVDILVIKCKMGPRNTESVLYDVGSSIETTPNGFVYPVADLRVMSKRDYDNNG